MHELQYPVIRSNPPYLLSPYLLTMSTKNTNPQAKNTHTEKRHIVIYGYTREELAKVMRHFEETLPEYVKISIDTSHLVTKITLTGIHSGVELLRFQINKLHRNLNDIFTEDVVSMEDVTLSETLGQILKERELSIACAESCTGGNLAHRITEIPGSSAYFLGSVVSYSNDVKANVLNVNREDISTFGAVSRQVVTAMAVGVAKLMHTDCAIATSGIAGPNGGTKFKPVGTVWMAVKYRDIVETECLHFTGDRIQVIESATNHSMMMLLNLLRNKYTSEEDFNDE